MKTLYRAALVHTLGHPASGEWVLVDGRHVERVGSGEPPASDRVVHLPGATIAPGAIDAHVHLTATGIHNRFPEVAAARSREEFLQTLSLVAGGVQGPVLVHGHDETKWVQAALPTLADMDAASARFPLIAVRADAHLSIANSIALEAAGVGRMPGAERDADGELTGVVRQAANDQVQRWYAESLRHHDIQELQLEAASLAAARGITCVHEMAMPASQGREDVEVLLDQRTRLPVDVVPYIATMEIPYVMDRHLSQIGGDLSLDGSIGARTACLSSPYVGGSDTGVAYLEEETLVRFLQEAHAAGLQVALHVIGDAAIEQAVTAWERVYQALDSRSRRHFRARRHRLEHFEMPTDQQIERTAALGLAISVQPAFDAAWGAPGQLYEQRLGERRAMAMNPFRTLSERGLTIGAGSDAPITPLNPMQGIAALEAHHDPAQRMARPEAYRLFTHGGARLAHLAKKGKLEPGTHADLVAYDADPMTAGDLGSLSPILTVSLGRDVYAR